MSAGAGGNADISSIRVHGSPNSTWGPGSEPWAGEGRSPAQGRPGGPYGQGCASMSRRGPDPGLQDLNSFPEPPRGPWRPEGEPAPNLGMEGGNLLLEVPLGLLLLLQLLLEGVLLILHLLQLGAQAQLLTVLLLQQLLLQGQEGSRGSGEAESGPRSPQGLRRGSMGALRSPHPRQEGGASPSDSEARWDPETPWMQGRMGNHGGSVTEDPGAWQLVLHGHRVLLGQARLHGPTTALTCVSCSWDSRVEKSLVSLLDLLSDWVRRPVTLSSSICTGHGRQRP